MLESATATASIFSAARQTPGYPNDGLVVTPCAKVLMFAFCEGFDVCF
jgi:hypothetical protein